jgi:hypothetical protein
MIGTVADFIKEQLVNKGLNLKIKKKERKAMSNLQEYEAYREI